MRPLCHVIFLAVLITGCAESKVIPATPSPPLARSVSAQKDTPAPPQVLSPQADQQQEDRLRRDAAARIEGAEQIIKQIDQTKLAKEKQDTFSTIQSFLAKAREAISIKDFQRAYNLADKAKHLAEELAKR